MDSYDYRRIRVLIVDKHEAVRRALQIRLSVPTNLEVVGVAADLESAIEQKIILKPDIIIFGLQRGTDEDLFQMAISVRELAQKPSVVIALAPYADAVEREVLLQAGVYRYLLKQINSEKLIDEIEAAASLDAQL